MLLILPFVSYLITLKRELLAKWQTFKTNFWILSKFIGFPPPLKLSMMSPSTFDGLSTFWRWRYFIWRERRNSCGVKSCQMRLTLAGGGGERRPCPYQKWLLASAIESLMSSTSSLLTFQIIFFWEIEASNVRNDIQEAKPSFKAFANNDRSLQ